MRLLPQEEWENWSIRLIYHGRAICQARKPLCESCALADLCPSAEIVDLAPAQSGLVKSVTSVPAPK
jgi:endonuclease III